jgi:hypothetical protein
MASSIGLHKGVRIITPIPLRAGNPLDVFWIVLDGQDLLRPDQGTKVADLGTLTHDPLY